MNWVEDHLGHLFAALIALCVAGIVAAVVASLPAHKLITAADGKGAWLVTCSSPGDCIAESSRACPAGFTVLSQAAERGSVTTYTNVGTGSSSSIGIPTTTPTYSGATVIRCGGAL